MRRSMKPEHNVPARTISFDVRVFVVLPYPYPSRFKNEVDFAES